MGFFDTLGLSSFKEIIIQEDGTIKALTDSGWIVIPSKDFDPIISTSFDETHQEITRWGKNVVIDEGEQVTADITVISGDVTVNGCVEGDVVVISGNIYINSTGYIHGDAISVGGRIKKEEGAKVTGSTISIRAPFLMLPGGSVYQMIQGIMLLVMIITVVFSVLSISLFPRPVNRIGNKLTTRPIKSYIFGYIFYIGVFIVWLLLLVTVIGIPLAAFGEPIAFLVLVIVAYSAVNQVVGVRLFKEKTLLKSFWLGCLVTTGIPFLLLFLGFLTNSLALFVINMVMLGFIIFVVLPFGLGAASLARFGFPPRVKKTDDIAEQSPPATEQID